jgi:hypothetical protein
VERSEARRPVNAVSLRLTLSTSLPLDSSDASASLCFLLPVAPRGSEQAKAGAEFSVASNEVSQQTFFQRPSIVVARLVRPG